MPNYEIDFIQGYLFKKRNYFEFDVLNDLKSSLSDVRKIFDIGANIGNHSVFWGKYSGAESIHAFEPVPGTFDILQKNISLNGLEPLVSCHNFGLGKERANASIAHFTEKNIGGTKIAEDESGALKIKALDEISGEYGGADFLKVDVEGFELSVFLGGKETLTKYKPMIFVETFKEDQKPVFEILKSLGYRIQKEYPGFNYLLSC